MPQSNEKLIVVDSNCIGHISKYSLGSLSYHEKLTGVIFGFLQHVLKLAIAFESTRFVFCWDSKKNFRKNIFPEYKLHRTEEKTPEEIFDNKIAYKQFYEIRRFVLPKFGFENIFIKTGLESDDLIANVVNQHENCVVVTTDNDLFQLLDRCTIYNPLKKKLISKEIFEKEYEIPVNMWAHVKAIGGCKSDGIPGIPNVGEKTAIRYLKGELKNGSSTREIIENSSTVINRFLLLTYLPFKSFQMNLSNKEIFYEDSFIDICREYGFTSFRRDHSKWKSTFDMK